MHLFNVVLFIHLLALVASAMTAGVMFYLDRRLIRADTVPQAGTALMGMKAVAPLFGVTALVLLLSGGYLTQHAFAWSDAWVIGGIVGLILMEFVGAAMLKPRSQKLGKRLAAMQGPQLSDDFKQEVRSPFWIGVGFLPMLLAFGVMFIMTTQPAAVGTVISLVVATALAFALAAVTSGTRRVSAPTDQASAEPVLETER